MPQLNLPIVSVVIFSVGLSCILLANFIFATILGEVNGRRGPQEQISMLFVNVRFFEVVRLHKELFPESRKRTVMYVFAALGFAAFLGALVPNLQIGPTR